MTVKTLCSEEEVERPSPHFLPESRAERTSKYRCKNVFNCFYFLKCFFVLF